MISRAVMIPNRFSHVEDVLSENPDRSSPEFPDPNPPLKDQPITETTSVRSSLAAQESHHNNLFLSSVPSLSILESYDAKVMLGWLFTREIVVEDELSTCLWLRLGEGNWNEKREFAILVWLLMSGGNMKMFIEGDADGLFLKYMHGGISEK